MNPLDSIINEVVNQFADPLAFFRELVQNAIDSGTQEIAISFSYENEAAVIRVNDFGEGMSLEIIQNKLTRLFASSKEDDFTKIGRFGIGFASVFAIEPDFVVVDTARSGEQWRVLFSPDRTWEVMELTEPREGTCITVVKTMSKMSFKLLEERATEVIKYWCRFVRVPILVKDVDIREPFAVDAAVSVATSEEETNIVAGFVPHREAQVGYYNRGLTLMEAANSRWPYMTFRIDSRYLEHTLTRDRIRETKHWERVVAMLDQVHTTLLPQKLLTEFREVSAGEPSARWAELMNMLSAIRNIYPAVAKTLADEPIFPTSEGTWISANTLAVKAKDRQAYLHTESHVAKRIDAVLVTGDPAIHEAAGKLFGFSLMRPEEAWISPLPVDNLPPLVALTREFLEMHSKVTAVNFVALTYEGSAASREVAIWGAHDEHEIHLLDWKKSREKKFFQFERVAFNWSHPAIKNAVEISQQEPEFAAYMLSKLLLARTGIPTEVDSVWMNKITTRRVARGHS